ncbi:E3 ubiquitin-protein ligase NHLRC1-like [Hemitrygon akajei]|uniref:E3 ubiquitin-protein ligase NHLRC1-like n=1 Tax=Hemitrygon akajei TaxID=2704970 RepID=UPI003BF97356
MSYVLRDRCPCEDVWEWEGLPMENPAAAFTEPMALRTARSLAQDIRINVLECKVCFEHYGDNTACRPCVLPCGHVVCRHCAQTLTRAGELQCPFCRRCGPSSLAADCLPLLQLAEMLGPEQGGSSGLPSQLRLITVYGGWGQLLNPRALAVCPELLAVADDSSRPVRLWERGERWLESDVEATGLVYPLGVALAGGGQLLLVTDGGDSSLKVFALGQSRKPAVVQDNFGLPWGVAAGLSISQVVLTDAGRGSLLLLSLRLPGGALLGTESVCEGLRYPREVAVCPRQGCIHVVEHLLPPGSSAAVRLKTFNSRHQLIRQLDSTGVSPVARIPAGLSAIAVDADGNVLVADGLDGTVGRVGVPGTRQYSILVDQGLIRPTGLACTADGELMVLDGGDNTWKVYADLSMPPARELS